MLGLPICHVDVECQDFKNFLKEKTVKFVIVDFMKDERVLGWIGLVVGNPFDLQKNPMLPSSGQPSMLILAGAMVYPSYSTLKNNMKCVSNNIHNFILLPSFALSFIHIYVLTPFFKLALAAAR